MSVQALHGNLNFTLPNLIEVNNARSPSLEGGFLNEFKTALDTISQNQIQAHNQAKAFEMGEPNTSLNEVMVDMQKSVVSLQFGIQVRNKLVAAYQEIMNMNV
ncbi:flagellar hook-basal body complex protein FliE [Frischella perrara]|uniref:Flagellar hook-basal body complex protein FliE n=1 Tax=Frischella perrara TaxID=1267021 RepID=A0A0A7S507_FRIPE|nr:flagellar hook-basal body complex protein FliE [Frischella perrara]AJA45892.1 flagellar hook-basal body complex protein FliE [Frischella perrara]MCT6875659.1 flagellar hook-basal body complex protein FliE [Frischella perrara]PWV62572.1 flagellar hook-basal body complex protein FliE [Frischella perrara]